MEKRSILRQCGLFDAKVPRYTSYPPANRFQPDLGARYQRAWLEALPIADPLSVYIHIPFCRRLCWFCACRTQGTKTLSPLADYIRDLTQEIKTKTALLSGTPAMARLHLGGGTPTLLDAGLMNELLSVVFESFERTDEFEFSVEIDPTEAAPEVLDTLAGWGMRRASIGVQDFDTKVQKAIGREQSFDQTRRVVERLRGQGVTSLNVDLLYGLPFQTAESLIETLDRVVSLRPDRMALYGYAHVPHMSKRQAMIPSDILPDAEQRFEISQLAHDRLVSMGYRALGIDHFATEEDSLARAAENGTMRRNFQGYTDDPCETLLGFGASAISHYPQGYLQNAVSTAAYRQRVQTTGLAAHKGYEMTEDDLFVAALIDSIMCKGQIDLDQMASAFPEQKHILSQVVLDLLNTFSKVLETFDNTISIKPGLGAVARLVAARLDGAVQAQHIHSLAV